MKPSRSSSGAGRDLLARIPTPLALVLPATLLLSCVDSTGPPHTLIELTEFAPSLGVDLDAMRKAGGGLYVEDIQLGDGRMLEYQQEVTLAYDLYLPDGTHVIRHEDAKFVLGCNNVVPGLAAGVNGMRVGGIRRLVVPPRMGYGEEAPWPLEVPPYSILVYEVEAIRSSTRSCMPGS